MFDSFLCLVQISDLIRYDSSKGEETLVYILTLGVVETYRKRGIGISILTPCSKLMIWIFVDGLMLFFHCLVC